MMINTKTSYLNSLISSTNCKLLDTRKTTPLNRKMEKWGSKNRWWCKSQVWFERHDYD